MMKLTSLAVLLVLVACGKVPGEKKSSSKSPRKVTATRESQYPILLKSMNANADGCSVESYTDAQRDISLSLFLRGEATDENRNFAGLLENLFVKDIGGKIISQSHKGQSILYSYTSTDDVITGGVSELAPASVVTVCPDVTKYERGSSESAAMSAAYYISKTSRKVSELLPDQKIEAVSVHIAPMIKKKLQVIVKGEIVWENESYETDNAYYMPGMNSITFLPHSEEFKKTAANLNFWEVPMVASHEYGHHIFRTLNPTSLEAEGLKSCFGHFDVESDGQEGEEEKREVSNEDVLGAFNEGFADLVSFYSLENNERGLKGVPCLAISRDVSSKVFANGAPKIYTPSALDEFFSTKNSEAPATCDTPNFQTIHIIGAIFANGVDRFLSVSTETKDQRLSIVLKWLQQMESKAAAMKALSPQDFLKESLKLMVDVAIANTDGKVDQAECNVLTEFYPGIDATITACLPPM